MRYAEAEAAVARGELPIIIVTLSAPGFTVRAAEKAITIEDAEGDGPYRYDETLIRCDGFNPEVSLFDLERAEISRARIALTLPDDVTPASLEMAWQCLTASKVEVAQVWEGQRWQDRRVWIGGGTVSGLKLGVAGQPIEFVAEAVPPAVGAVLGDETRSMGDYYPSLGFTKLDGKAWPLIIGRVYRVPVYKLGIQPTLGSGAAGTRVAALAGHHFANLTLPTFYEDSNDTAYGPTGVLSLYNNTDGGGDPICIVQGSTDGTEFDFSLPDLPRGGGYTFDAEHGGVRAARGTGAALRADGVVSYVLAESGETIDWPRMQPALDRLTTWEIGLYVDRPPESLRLLRDRLLPYLPLIEEQGEDGLWLRYVDIFNEPAEADLVEGVHLVDRLTDLEQVTDPDELRNSVTINFFFDSFTGEYLRSFRADRTNNALCALSHALHGTRAANAINCNITWDDETAARMAHFVMNRLALHRFATTWIIDPSCYDLREGTIVRLTAPTLGLASRRCVVRKVNAKMNPPRATFETIPGTTTTLGV